jgi:uncharacterized repeat protein (TIGR01451 family)
MFGESSDLQPQAIGRCCPKAASQSRCAWRSLAWRFVFCMLLIGLTAAGCKTLSLPAINPNGGTIFSGGSTTLVAPHGTAGGYPAQGPAYQAPPEPKKCHHGLPTQDGKGGHGCKLCAGKHESASDARARCGQLLLTPTRIVAPVGGEVILLAGICGKDGNLVTKEPIEWMLSPESVGQFIDVGDDTKGKSSLPWSRSAKPQVEKVGVDFARGRTSSEDGRITRGTAKTEDDLPVRKGQTWLSLSSPTEGVSKVTVMAPESEAWDQRRQTATIYWVDASWQFPQTQQASSGQSVTLVTKVLRAEGFAPAEGWLVRYRSLNPEVARFLDQYGEVFEKQVDRNGNAIVEVINMQQPGVISSANATALIEMEVIRPSQGSENMPELPLGRGTVQVTWTAPELVLKAAGPESALPGQPLAYSATIENDGYAQAENVVLSLAIPNGMTIQSISVPPTRQTATNLSWEIGVLGPRQALDVQVVVEATTDMDARIVFDVTSASGGGKNAVVSTLVQKPQLTLNVNPDPTTTQVGVGETATFNLKLTNTGNQTITDLILVLDAAPGLAHIRDGATQVTRDVGYLPPGKSVDLSAQFVVEREGDLAIKATAQSSRQILAAGQASVRGMPAPQRIPQVDLEMRCSTGANPIAINAATSVQLFVRNTGPVAVRNLFLTVKYDPALSPTGASAGYEPSFANQIIRWRIPELAVGTSTEYQINFAGVTPTADAQVVGQVESEDRGIRVMRNVGVPITGPAPGVNTNPSGLAPPPGGGPPAGMGVNPVPPNAAVPQGDLMVVIEPTTKAVRMNEQSSYMITVRNNSAVNQQRVELQLRIPEGVRVIDVQGPSQGGYQYDEAGRLINMEAIQTMRPQEVIAYRIEFRHELVGEGRLIATVQSSSSREPASAMSTISTLTP